MRSRDRKSKPKHPKSRRYEEEHEKKVPDFEIIVPSDPANEMAVIGAMLADLTACDRIRPFAPVDAFQAKENKLIREAIEAARVKNLALDPATLSRLRPEIDLRIVEHLAIARPDVPARSTLDFHLEQLSWDWRRSQAMIGPMASLLELVQDSTAEPDRVRAVARQVGDAFNDVQSRFIRDKKQVISEAMAIMRRRQRGEAWYPFGIPGLDHDEKGKRRHRPGTAPGEVTMLTARSGSGKALALDTPIATPNGWTTMGEVDLEDIVFDENGMPCEVTYCSPVMKGRPCYEVLFSDGSTIVADAEHLWETQTGLERRAAASRTYRARTYRARDFQRFRRGAVERREGVSTKLLSWWEGKRKPSKSIKTTRQIAETVMSDRGEHNHSIQVALPLVTATAPLLVDPYLLGAWLGDGASAGAVIYTADEEIVEAFRERYTVNKGYSKDPYRYNVSKKGVRSLHVDLKTLGVLGSKQKHIPTMYLRADIEQRRELLRGLMDTDGCISVQGHIEFCTTSPRLASDFFELVTSLGVQTRSRESDATLYGRVVGRRWRFQFKTDFQPFRLERKAVRWIAAVRQTTKRRYVTSARRVKSVPVRCIQVDSPSHLYLAGRSMIPTHNTTVAAHMIRGQAKAGRRVLVGAWEVIAPMTLELITTIDLGWSRSRTLDGRTNRPYDADEEGEGDPITDEELDEMEAKMTELSEHITFIDNPFQRGRRGQGRTSNEDHLDTLEDHITMSGADVVILDLFDRVLRDNSPEDEKEAFFRALDIAARRRVHLVLVHQQLLKGRDVREDKKPSIEGLKGSSACVDVAATIIAPHLPARVKNVPDNTLEIYGLKTRHGPPFAIEFDWEPDTARMSGGRTISMNEPIETDEAFSFGPPQSRRPQGGGGGRGFHAGPKSRRRS